MSEELLNEHLRRWEPFKIEFLDEKDRLYQLDSAIEDISDEYMIIGAPKFRNEKYNLPVGSEVSIVFYRRDGMLYTQSTILSQESSFGSKIKTSLPYNVELIERRRTKKTRLSLKMEIEYYINKNSLNKKVLNETAYDISATGISFISDTPFGKYHGIKCYIYLHKNFSDPVIAECKYINSRAKQVRDKTLYQIAFEFTRISREDSLRLQEKCYRISLV